MLTAEPLDKQLVLARRELLDLSTANRLLNTKRNAPTGAAIEIKEESAAEIFRLLVIEGKTIRFEEGELVDVDEDPSSESEINTSNTRETKSTTRRFGRRTTKKRRVAVTGQPVDLMDDVLHTDLDPDELDRRLNRLVTDGSAILQDQGVNVLYLALGFLRWQEPNSPDTQRHAPLLLIPVKLERAKGGSRYSLSFNGDQDINDNFTLQTRLLSDLGITLPPIPEELEELKPADYFASVKTAVGGQAGWEVLPNDIVLWFFSFSKLLMYRDLNPENWPSIQGLDQRPLVRQLLQEGFKSAEPLIGDDQNIDSLIDPVQSLHVIDCDSSQALVIEEATRGRSLVIQGPPGTGKSQTITNLIAASIAAGRSILFVAEKMAALEVVKRRLDNIGLGDMVLELHSNKTNKRAMLQEIDRTLKQGSPILPTSAKETIEQLKQKRNELSQYVEMLHQPFDGSSATDSGQTQAAQKAVQGPTPYQVLTELILLRSQDTPLPDFQIPEATQWSESDFSKKVAAVTDLASVMNSIGEPSTHPWCGCNLESISPMDLERALRTATERITELNAAYDSSKRLSEKFGVEPATTLRQMEDLTNTVEALLKAPTLDQQAYQGPAWSDYRPRITELVEQAINVINAQSKLKDVVTDSAWDKDVSEAYEAYAKHGQSLFRMLNGTYRQARSILKQCLKGIQPSTFEERLEILKLLKDYRVGLKKLNEANVVGEKSFGRLWLGNQTDWQTIVNWEQWDRQAFARGVHPRFRSLLSLFIVPGEFQKLAQEAAAKQATFHQNFQALTRSLQIDLTEAYAKWGPATEVATGADHNTKPQSQELPLGNAPFAPLEQIRNRLQSWKDQPERFQQWQTYRRSVKEVAPIGNWALADRIANGKIPAGQAANVLRFARAEAILREVFKKYPQLETFEGAKFEKLIEDFCKYDVARIELARSEIAKYHWEGISRPKSTNIGSEVATLRHEMQKQRRHKPIRQLLKESGAAIQAVKPVFMMSPISVAQYLVPGGLEFDMLLIDEASQVRPVESLGAAARCKQIVVVGDDKQMPPTQFFGRAVGEIDEEDAPDMQAADVESILSLAIAQNMPQRMLRWHYRSKHESLIAVSNREFYDNQLYVIPSPERFGELGVKLTLVENGKFLKGKNDIEAKVVAEAIMKHAKEKPKWTLGVAAFSVVQRDAIIDELEKLRKVDNSCEAFFDPNAPDPFFIKNLENVQGDERDAIFVSVGYGPGEDGKVSLNFGPVSNAGGERRLNVLMTRAKSVLRIFSSMRAEDIDLSRATGRGPAVFREYLAFAQERMAAAASSSAPISPAKASSAVARDQLGQLLKTELEKRGYKADTGIGLAGLFVDVAVIDPNQPGRYLIGFSLDGESYRSARSTRDRNRTSDGVLSAQGWLIHRIWTPEWFLKPKDQMDRLYEVIEVAKQGQFQRRPNRLASPVSQIDRKPSGVDPLTMAVGSLEKAPPKVERPKLEPIRSEPTYGAPRAGSPRAEDSSPAKKSFMSSVGSVLVMTLKFLGAVLVEIIKLMTTSRRKSGSRKSRTK